MREMRTRMVPDNFIASTMVESGKHKFVNEGRSSDALTFDDLYKHFSALVGPTAQL